MRKENKVAKIAACSVATAALIPAGVLVAQAATQSTEVVNNEVSTTVVAQDRMAPADASALKANNIDATAYAANNLSLVDRMGGTGTLAGIVLLGGIGLAGGVSLTRSFMIG